MPSNRSSQAELPQPGERVENLRTEECCKANTGNTIAQTPIEMPAEHSACLREDTPTDEVVTDSCPEGMHSESQENITEDSIIDTKLEEKAASCEDTCTNLECEGQQEESVLMIESEDIARKSVLVQSASNGDCGGSSVYCDEASVETLGPSEDLPHNQGCAVKEDACQGEMMDNMLIVNDDSPDGETIDSKKNLEVKVEPIPIVESKLENVKNCVESVTDENVLNDNGGSTEGFPQVTDGYAIELNNGSPPLPEQIAEVKVDMESSKDESSADIDVSITNETNETNAEARFE
eukprot:g32789.t1